MAAQLLRREASAQGFVDRMALNTHSPYTQSPQEFCLALRTARERNGITLPEIANATKIPASMFAALERGDLRRWPKGLFRRSFFREYVRMIGVPAAEACEEFVRLFPDHEGAERTKPADVVNETGQAEDDVRLVLDAAWHGPRTSVLSRLLTALIDSGAVVLMATAIARIGGVDWPATTAIVALAYFSVATVVYGHTPAKRVMAESGALLGVLTHGPAAIAAAWRGPAAAISQVLGRDGGTPEPVEEPEMRTWVTDAHPVGPAHSPRLRVRIKLSQ